MKNYHIALLVMSAFLINNITANDIEEIIVTSSYIDKTLNEIDNPLHVVDGDDISSSSTQSLGESLDSLLGVSSTDYGSGVGQPIIRGMSGSRVKILNNGMVNRDVSGLGADHINDIDLNNIQQIEVVRGPSSLLYSNGAIGGIVNIVDNTIAMTDFQESKFQAGYETQSVNSGDTQNLSYENNVAGFNLTFAYKNSGFGNFDIPTGAIIHHEEEHEDEEHEDEDHDEDHDEDMGFLANSDFESESSRFGVSKTGEWGFFGVSMSNIESLYGIPFHGEGHEGHDDHGEEHDEEEHHEEDERIFSSTDSDKLDIKGLLNLDNAYVNSVAYYFRDTEYSLTEQHAEHEEEGHDEHEDEDNDEHEEEPTIFSNNSSEYGFTFDLSNDTASQKLVFNFVNEDTSIVGHEAFMNPASNDELTIGFYRSGDFDLFHVDLGIRYDQINTSGSMSHEEDHDEDHGDEDHDDEDHDDEDHDIEYFDMDKDNLSIAFSAGRELNENLNVSFGFASVERAPSVIELFMNGPHLSTGRFEVGNENLDSEKSNNIDFTLNFDNDNFYGVATFFKNNVDNYIYLLDETEDEHEEHDEDHEEGHDDHGGLILANYLQQDAELDGYEIEFGKVMTLGNGNLTLSFGRDVVNGKFSDGTNIPRLNPARNIYSLAYSEDDLMLTLSLKDVEKQNDIGINEEETNGYQMLNAKAVKTFKLNNDSEFRLSLFANNLFDEVARNHSSFVKDQVPLPGKNYGIKFNFTY